MTTARAELKDMDLNKVIGGVSFNEAAKTITKTKDSQSYIGASYESIGSLCGFRSRSLFMLPG